MPRKKKAAAPAVDDAFVDVSPITYGYCQEAPLYELAANAVNLLCAIANRRGHCLGLDPESCIERAIGAAAEVAVMVKDDGL